MAAPTTHTELACAHCGDPCRGTITSDGRQFCCLGCRSVFELLGKHNLGSFYEFGASPSPIYKGRSDQFAYLDDPEIANRLMDHRSPAEGRVTFTLPSIHCSACIWLLENLCRLNDGVLSSRVDFLQREASIVFDNDKLSLRKLAELLASLGYEPQISLKEIDDDPPGKNERRHPELTSLYGQLAVAGFCFANIMLFSFPDYFGIDRLAESTLVLVFGYLNLALALPVLLYSARSFFASAWRGLRQRQINMDLPISLGLAMLFARSTWEILVAGSPGYLDSFAGLVFFLLIGKLYQQKTYRALSFDRDYKSYFPVAVIRRDKEGEHTVGVTSLVPGDKICVRNRELIPADSILGSSDAKIDYSFVTGESEPVMVQSGEIVFAGGRQMGESIELLVKKKPSQSYLTSLWNEAGFSGGQQTSITSLSNRISRWFTLAVLLAAFAAGVYWLLADPSKAINAASAVLIVACPCALALATPFTLGTAQRLLGKTKLYLKSSHVVEDLANIDEILFDKTGTLTYPHAESISFVGAELSPFEKSIIKSLVRNSTHPLSMRLTDWLQSPEDIQVKDYTEEPGKGLAGVIDGRRVRLGSARWTGVEQDDEPSDDDGSGSRVFVAINDAARGHFVIHGKFRAGLAEVARRLSKKYRLTLLTGDTNREQSNLKQILTSETELCFDQLPHDKLAFVRDRQGDGKRLLMVGDGLNDAGALGAAEVGIALSEENGAFSPGCDAIMHSGALKQLPDALRLARASMTVIKLSFGISFLYNLIGLAYAAQGVLSPLVAAILMPASSVSVVLFATLATRLAAGRLGAAKE